MQTTAAFVGGTGGGRHCSDGQYSNMALSHLRDYLIINFWFLFINRCLQLHPLLCYQYAETILFRLNPSATSVSGITSGGRSNLKVGAYGERGAWAYKVVWGRSPQRGPGAESLVRGSGGKAPWSWKVLGRKDRKYLHLYPTFESAEISPKHCLESK